MELKFFDKPAIDAFLNLKIEKKQETELLADICRFNTLYMIKRAGSGHIGSSFSAMEIIVTLYNQFLKTDSKSKYTNDIFYSSKGHDAPGYYSVLAALGFLPFEKIHQLRRIEGLPGHPDVHTPHIATNTGSLGMGVSKAKGFLISKKLKKNPGTIFVMTGDGELQEGQFWESLRSAVTYKLNDIIVLVDRNKLQSDTYVKDVLDLGDLKNQFQSFGWYATECTGHNITDISSTLEKTMEIKDKPKAIIFDTVKGHGVSFMAPNAAQNPLLYNYHSGAPNDEDYEQASDEIYSRICEKMLALKCTPISFSKVPKEQTQSPQKKLYSLVEAYSQAIFKQATENKNLHCLVADLVKDTGLYQVKTKLPAQFWECGIAEQDMVSMAGTMALNGLTPVVHSFACFLTPRANEQIFNNYTENTRVIYTATLAGLCPSGPGHSHQSLRDISLMSSLPQMLCYQPANAQEVEWALDYFSKQHEGSSYLRIGSVPTDLPDYKSNLAYGQGTSLLAGKDVAVIAYGGVMLSQALKANELLTQKNISSEIINLPWLNKFDKTWVSNLLKTHKKVVLIDDHFAQGSQGEMLMSYILKNNIGCGNQFLHLHVEDTPACGRNDEVLKAHQLDGASIAKRIEAWL